MNLIKKTADVIYFVAAFLAISLALTACSSNTMVTPPATPTVNHEAAIPEIKVFYAAPLPIMTALLENSELDVKLSPVDEQFSYVCGGVFADADLITKVLMDAEVVFRLSGVMQEWVPIEGKLDEYFIFSLDY